MTERDRCVFCDIVAGRAPAFKVLEDERAMCILDINPWTKGHCLVISKRHVPWWHDLEEDEVLSLFRLARTVARRMMKTLSPEFVCLYARGRRIPHTHIFLIPTAKDDVLDRFFNALEKLQEAPPGLMGLRDRGRMEEAARLLDSGGEDS